jgi:hypothetical protein
MNLSEFRLFRAVDIQEPGEPWSHFEPGRRNVTSIEQAAGVVLIHREGARDLMFALSAGYAFVDNVVPSGAQSIPGAEPGSPLARAIREDDERKAVTAKAGKR